MVRKGGYVMEKVYVVIVWWDDNNYDIEKMFGNEKDAQEYADFQKSRYPQYNFTVRNYKIN